MSVTTLPVKQPDGRAILRTQLEKMSGAFRGALPAHIKTERFQQVVLTSVQLNPDLMLADRRSLLVAATKCAQDGLLPDGREAAFVIFNTKVKDVWIKLVQYMPMIAGIKKRAMNSGLVASLQGHVVYENDHFVWHQGTEEKLEHIPLFPGERGQPIGAYAVARLKGETLPLFRVMDKDRIEKVRAVSRAKNGPAWTGFWDEMAIKTVTRNLGKDLPAEAGIERVASRDDETPALDDSAGTIDAVLTDDQRLTSSRLDLLEGEVTEGEGEAS